MGNRLSKIYTRTGDKGDTSLADGSRVSKASKRIEVIGDIDELNCQLGLLRTETNAEIEGLLATIQNNLFDLGADLALPAKNIFLTESVEQLERQLDELNERLEPLKEFILPGGNKAAALCHVARAVCRRAERNTVALAADNRVNAEVIHYLNRLSDFLFVLARYLNKLAGDSEVYWHSPNSRIS